MQNTTYILIGKTNPYQAKGNGLFRGRTIIAADTYYGTAAGASAKLMQYCADESDNHGYNATGTKVEVLISYDSHRNVAEHDTVMEEGAMAYHHDGYTWSFVRVHELDEAEAEAALAYGIGANDEQTIYEIHPDLAPVAEDEEASN
jgi:hypothetical protein